MPLRLALGVRGTVAGHRLGALEGGEGGGGYFPPFKASLASVHLHPPHTTFPSRAIGQHGPTAGSPLVPCGIAHRWQGFGHGPFASWGRGCGTAPSCGGPAPRPSPSSDWAPGAMCRGGVWHGGGRGGTAPGKGCCGHGTLEDSFGMDEGKAGQLRGEKRPS